MTSVHIYTTKQIKEITNTGQVANIPTKILFEDLHNAQADLTTCRSLLSLGVIKHKNTTIQDRHDENLNQINIIKAELEKRKL